MRPSIRSRSRSACPLWRAYSSIMCTSNSRSETGSPSESQPTNSEVVVAGELVSEGDLLAPRRPRLLDHRRVSDRPVEVGVGVLVGAVASGYVLPGDGAGTRRVPPRPCAGSGRAVTWWTVQRARRASCSASNPAHFSSSVSRWPRRNSFGVARWSPSRRAASRGSEPGSRKLSARCCGVLTATQATGAPALPRARCRAAHRACHCGAAASRPPDARGSIGPAGRRH